MIKTAAGHFVTARDDFADQTRILLGDPAEHEKRRFGVEIVEQIERLQSILLVARLEMRPVSLLNQILKGADMEIVFDQNRQQMFFV